MGKKINRKIRKYLKKRKKDQIEIIFLLVALVLASIFIIELAGTQFMAGSFPDPEDWEYVEEEIPDWGETHTYTPEPLGASGFELSVIILGLLLLKKRKNNDNIT